jgi:hypothetical protein
VRWANHLPSDEPLLFLEVTVGDPSDFATVVEVRREEIGGYRVLRAEGSTVPNTIAALLLHARDLTGRVPTPTSSGPRSTRSRRCSATRCSARATSRRSRARCCARPNPTCGGGR